MNQLFDIIRDIIKKRMTGVLVIPFRFGGIKNPQFRVPIDLSDPVNIGDFKQKRDDPFKGVVGQ